MNTKALSEEQIDKLGFTPTEAEVAQVDRMAESIIQDLGAKKRFEGRRNRSAWKSMNRPHIVKAQEKGSEIIHKLIDRVILTETVEA
jgi:hypothetical protein